MKIARLAVLALLPALGILGTRPALAAGTLKPKDSGASPITIQDHHVDVVIRDGFARTTVTQVFSNPNPMPLEAVYTFPLPKSGALCEVTVTMGDAVTMRGEVVERQKARDAYEEEKNQGNDAALAEKDGYQSFDFAIANLKPNAPATISFTYYQNLKLDAGVGRYQYPLAEGGTDEVKKPFWEVNDAVEGKLSIELDLRSAYPVEKVYAPGLAGAVIDGNNDADPGHHHLSWSVTQGKLDKDFVFYYALADGTPGRIEVVPYRADDSKPGTFMMVVTPGVDLKPLALGSDYTFVLDTSGSMESKLGCLADGVSRSIASLHANDRFRVITFNDDAKIVSGGFLPATPDTVAAAIETVKGLRSTGSTNLEAGVKLALRGLESDRTQSILLVTDGVANVGEVSPKGFVKLLDKVDVRVFGFLLGNSANWPMLEAITATSGGFYETISNQDDIPTRLALVKQKLLREAMHGVKVDVSGQADVFDVDDLWFGNVYAGQQLVVFGRYRNGGEVNVRVTCKLSGEEKVYATTFELPKVDTENPELERMFALHRVEAISTAVDRGLADADESKTAIRDLGLQYQIVTEETSMLVLKDEAFTRRGIERKNLAKTEMERAAQAIRTSQPVVDRQVDKHRPAFHAPSFSHHSGAIDGIFVVASGLILLVVVFGSKSKPIA